MKLFGGMVETYPGQLVLNNLFVIRYVTHGHIDLAPGSEIELASSPRYVEHVHSRGGV